MVQFRVLTGKQAGAVARASRFPWRIGRASDNDLRLEEPGVWEHHLDLLLDVPDGFKLALRPNALTTVNGQSAVQQRLRNGDVIELGSVKLQFWLSDPRQSRLLGREVFTWMLLAALAGVQVAMVYWLQR
ncbi:MAG: FHA domain-containing protein [Verrucomicrobia bacterium]|nr:FHA domain-containing protein [Verrucomicrobiota bacterium]